MSRLVVLEPYSLSQAFLGYESVSGIPFDELDLQIADLGYMGMPMVCVADMPDGYVSRGSTRMVLP